MIPILIKGKPLITPAGLPMEVPTEALADSIVKEWDDLDKSTKAKESQGKLFTSLAATALDRIPEIRDEIIQQLARICENDQLLCWSDQSKSLVKAQEDQWRLLVDFVNSQLGIRLQPRYDLDIRVLGPDEDKAIKDWCRNLSPFQLSAFAHMGELSHSFMVPFCLVEGLLEESIKAWDIAELHENHQRIQWGEDKEAMERSANLGKEFDSSYVFFRVASIEAKE